MICALSGETSIEEPVVSVKSGHVFEKRLIEKFLRDSNGKCPITDVDLSSSDLIPLKVSKVVKPRPPAATSIPSMLQLFQNEWDALMLESFTLKQQLDSVRQELAHALYQHDAACRVIARLIKERDDARNTLGQVSNSQADTSNSMEVEEPSLSSDIVGRMQSKFTELSQSRKKRVISESLSSLDDIKGYKATSSHPIHSTNPAGILCVDIHPDQEQILTGGVDHNLVIFNKNTKKTASTIKGHSKQVNSVLFHPSEPLVFSASSDKTARVWNTSKKNAENVFTIKTHKDDVTRVSLQATEDFLATSSLDGTCALHDLSNGSLLFQINVEDAANSMNFHPDGLLLGVGTKSGAVKIYDVKTQKSAASFDQHTSTVVDITFSENGFYLATASQDNTVKLWDLRKLKSVHSFDVQGAEALAFDYSGSYLAASSNKDIRIFTIGKAFKAGSPESTLTGHTGVVTGLKWGKDCTWLASTSMDRNLKIWG